MANIHTVRDLLDAVIENGTTGKRVQLTVGSKNEYETIRTRLVKLWTEHRDVIIAISDDDPLAQLSLCGDFVASDFSATFYLGKSRRRQAKSYAFAIIETDATSDPQLPSAVNDELPPNDTLPIAKRAQ
jgi:hypothetical protein